MNSEVLLSFLQYCSVLQLEKQHLLFRYLFLSHFLFERHFMIFSGFIKLLTQATEDVWLSNGD